MTGALTFRFSSHEAAPRLPDSEGEAKGRLHLFEYNGASDQHRYAVAAEKVTFLFSLFWCFLQNWYIIHEQQEGSDIVQYRIPKASLKKRLGISDEKVESLADSAKFKKFIGKREAQIKGWTNPTDCPFAQNFVAGLIENKISCKRVYILFAKSSEISHLKDEDKKNYLIIGYQDSSTVPEFPKEACTLALDYNRFKAIKKGKDLLPEEILQVSEFGNIKKEKLKNFLATSTEHQVWILKGTVAERLHCPSTDPFPVFNEAFALKKTTNAGKVGYIHLGKTRDEFSQELSKIRIKPPAWVPQQEVDAWLATIP